MDYCYIMITFNWLHLSSTIFLI